MRLRTPALALGLLASCRSGPAPLRLGTTYTVQQSGALAVLESLWTSPAPLTTVVAPSGQILRSAANGDLDVVITHAPALERRLLVGPGHALLRCPLAASRFAVVGLAARVLFAADTALTNPYTLYLVRRPEPHPAARAFATWATHAGRAGMLALRLPDGMPAFVVQPGDCEATATR